MEQNELKKVTLELNNTMRKVIQRMIREEICNQQKLIEDDKDLGLDFSERELIITILTKLWKEVE